MHVMVTAEQLQFAAIFAAAASVIVPPRGFGVVKRLAGAVVIFGLVLVYAAADNNLQMIHASVSETVR